MLEQRGSKKYRALHAKNRCSASNIQNNLVLEQVRILINGVLVGIGSHLVFLAEDTI